MFLLIQKYMRYKITLSYSGAPYCGWQSQDNAPTVQGEVERALALLLGGPVKVTGAGRTDTGVNALAYPAHFDTDIPIDATHLLYKLNAIVGKGIVFHSIERRHDGFHARFDATKRTYNYFIHRKKDPFVDEFSYFYPYGLDIAAMNEAAALLKGEMDFSAFEKTGADNATSVCNVFSAGWKNYVPSHLSACGLGPGDNGDYLVFEISANRFLRNMVRAIVGTLLEIGRGKHGPEWITGVIASKDRGKAGQSVPGKALFLTRVDYPDKNEI